jgi:hypothetical protein
MEIWVDQWADEWGRLLARLPAYLTDGATLELSELHEDLVELGRETVFASHDLAQALLLLLEKGEIQGRWGKVILEYTHEWVHPLAQEGVRDLLPYLSFWLQEPQGFQSIKESL